MMSNDQINEMYKDAMVANQVKLNHLKKVRTDFKNGLVNTVDIEWVLQEFESMLKNEPNNWYPDH